MIAFFKKEFWQNSPYPKKSSRIKDQFYLNLTLINTTFLLHVPYLPMYDLILL